MIRLLLALTLCVSPAAAQETPEQGAPGYEAVDRDILPVVALFYNLELGKAMKAARAIEVLHPGHPAGPFYASVVHYERYLIEPEISTAAIAGFEFETDRCIDAAKKYKKTDPGEAHYYMGGCYGFQARMKLAMGKEFGAIRLGRKAVRHLKKARKLQPERVDAKLGLGLYDYYIAIGPKLARPLAFLVLGLWGDRERGLEDMEHVAREGGPARYEAQTVLGLIYSTEREARLEEAEAMLAGLEEKLPGNPMFRMIRIRVALYAKDWEKAIRLSDPTTGWVEKINPIMRDRVRAVGWYRMAEAYILSGRILEAEVPLGKVASKHRPGNLPDWVKLRQAQILEAKGEPEAAKILRKNLPDDTKVPNDIWTFTWPPTALPD